MRDGKLSPGDVAILETFVVPQYLATFAEAALRVMLAGESARVAHLGCRTGYPDRLLLEKVSSCSIVGVDSSLAAIELARNKAGTLSDADLEYLVQLQYPTELQAETFSHALCLHPIGAEDTRAELFEEMDRLLYPGGQAMIALPLRGSFQEVIDLFLEYALKYDAGEFGKRVEYAMANRPTMETLTDEMEEAGFDDVDVEIISTTLSFEGGRAFTEDPATRLLIVPELEACIGTTDLGAALDYSRDAIDKYFSRSDFELSMKVGCASARKA